jgi:hypothetical protein
MIVALLIAQIGLMLALGGFGYGIHRWVQAVLS